MQLLRVAGAADLVPGDRRGMLRLSAATRAGALVTGRALAQGYLLALMLHRVAAGAVSEAGRRGLVLVERRSRGVAGRAGHAAGVVGEARVADAAVGEALLRGIVMGALAGVGDAAARAVAAEAVGRGAEVRIGSVRERRGVVPRVVAVEVARLAARGTRGREAGGGHAGLVAGPAVVARHALEAGVARRASGVGRRTVVVAHAAGGAVVRPRRKRVRRRGGDRQRDRRAGAQHQHDDQARQRPARSPLHGLHLPTAPQAAKTDRRTPLT